MEKMEDIVKLVQRGLRFITKEKPQIPHPQRSDPTRATSARDVQKKSEELLSATF
jgi:hypothetical protein